MRTLLIILAQLSWTAQIFAATPPDAFELCAHELQCRIAGDDELDRIRGGFTIDTGLGRLEIGIGITRAVAVNDRLVAVSHLVLPDVSQIVAAARTQADVARAGGMASGQAAVAAAAQAAAAARALNQAFASPQSSTAAATQPAPTHQVLINDVATGSAGPVTALGNSLIVQNGGGNVAPPLASFNGLVFPTIIQNSLNDQVLRTLTLINASVSSLSALNSIALGDILSRATAASGR